MTAAIAKAGIRHVGLTLQDLVALMILVPIGAAIVFYWFLEGRRL